MIHSSAMTGSESTWIDSVQSAEKSGNDKSFEYAFSSLSVGGNSITNRPPALSTSSISSYGEETAYNSKQQQDISGYTYAPPSPLTPSPGSRNQYHSGSGMSLSSPIIGRHDRQDDAPRGFNYFGESPIGRNANTPRKENIDIHYERDIGRSNKGFHDLSNKHQHSSHESMWSPCLNNHDFLSSNAKTDLRAVKSDITEESSFRSWHPKNDGSMLMSPGNLSTHSLQNMSSVDENEQFLGNGQGRVRARTLSSGKVGYRSMQHFGELNGQPPSGNEHRLSMNHCMDTNNNVGKGNSGPGFLRSPQMNQHRQITRVSSFPLNNSASNVIQENLVHVHSQCGSEGTLLNDHYASPRQRVMSADAVNRNGLNRIYRQPLYENQEMIGNSPQMRLHRPSSAGDIQHNLHNRPRSYSSGASSLGRSPRSFLDTPPSRNEARGNLISQMHANDNHYPVLPLMQQKGMNDEDMLGFSGGLIHNHNVPSSAPHSLNGIETYHYYQNQVVSSPITSRAIYTVKFKRSQRNFVLSPRIQGDIKIGTHVKVEADRGEDLGIVLSRVPAEKFNHSPRTMRYGNMDPLVPGNTMNMPEMKKILSVATNEEITMLQVKKEEEEELLKICRGKTLQRGLPMNVVDAEYQFDRHKLTFFFEAEGRIDFRELVRELFSIYKTRIWMQQIDKNSPASGSSTNFSSATTAVSEDSDGIVSVRSESSK